MNTNFTEKVLVNLVLTKKGLEWPDLQWINHTIWILPDYYRQLFI